MINYKRAVELAFVGLVGASLAGASLAGAAIAQDGAANITARQKAMREIQVNMMAVNDAAGNSDLPRAKEASIKLNAAFRDAATRFTPGSNRVEGKTTRAKAEIWSDPAGFKAKVDNAIAMTDRVGAASSGTNAQAAQLAIGEVNALCADCHTVYRGGG